MLGDARSASQSLRGRIDCAFESGYQALLAVLGDEERRSNDHPDAMLIVRACARLDLETEMALRLAKARYYPAEHSEFEHVLRWAEQVRARAKLYLERD